MGSKISVGAAVGWSGGVLVSHRTGIERKRVVLMFTEKGKRVLEK